jgi:hypothetical protein
VLRIGTWVMSCRAFSRRIEHQCLARLFERFAVDGMVLDFQSTRKNGPVQEFLSGILDEPPGPTARLTRSTFASKCPKLYHRIVEIEGSAKMTSEGAAVPAHKD